jgi:signal transduction histidine kinase
VTKEALRGVELFDELSSEQLAALAAASEEAVIGVGETLVRPGELPDAVSIVLEGGVEWSIDVNGEWVVLGIRDAPTYFGAINILLDQPSEVTGRAAAPSRLLRIGADDFRALLRDEPSVLRQTLARIAPVNRSVEAQLRQREKLASLGTLSAGLAHELNNPAAAASRSATELARSLDVLADTVHHFVSSGIEREDAERLVALQRRALAGGATVAARSSIELSAREAELERAIDARGQEGWRLAAPLAEAGVDEAWIDEIASHSGPAFGAALAWVVASLTARTLAAEVEASTNRISEIVAAVKEYTFMDRGALQEVDVNAALESTLTMLRHELKRGSVLVEREYDEALPPILASGSELNQVWTNLIDNAIDAVNGDGTITIRTRHDADTVIIEIADDGPGIPEHVQSRIFEPFYTTKDVGEGTGLGLDVSRRIIDGHDGSIIFITRPGDTRFVVSLPRRPRRQRAGAAVSTRI